MTDEFASGPQVASFAPATFAIAASVSRFALAPLSRSHPLPLLLIGGVTAIAGSLLLALAPTVVLALAGLALAAAGTAVLFPTLLSYSLRSLDFVQRARATSGIATTAYLGYLLGPAYVGFLAGAIDPRGAIVGVAVLAVAFTVLVWPTGRWVRRVLTAR